MSRCFWRRFFTGWFQQCKTDRYDFEIYTEKRKYTYFRYRLWKWKNLQKKTGAYIHGFDYSEKAIETAQSMFTINAEFKEGIIGEINYSEEEFDAIISMDTMYFAKDMVVFISQVKKWLKKDGVLFVGYQEGDVMPKTKNEYTTVLANALEKNEMNYEVTDITKEIYDLLKKKRASAMMHQVEFELEGNKNWFDMLIGQTESASESFEQFQEKMARYIYVIKK